MNQQGIGIEELSLSPAAFSELLEMLAVQQINQTSAKKVLDEMLTSGKSAAEIVEERGLLQVSDEKEIAEMVSNVLLHNANQVGEYAAGKQAISGWLFGQVMQASQGRANPQVVRQELDRQLAKIRAAK